MICPIRYNLEITCTITRNGEQIFSGSEYLRRANQTPSGTVLLTGHRIIQ